MARGAVVCCAPDDGTQSTGSSGLLCPPSHHTASQELRPPASRLRYTAIFSQWKFILLTTSTLLLALMILPHTRCTNQNFFHGKVWHTQRLKSHRQMLWEISVISPNFPWNGNSRAAGSSRPISNLSSDSSDLGEWRNCSRFLLLQDAGH